jgi:lipopolysaccharide/colanic/teichoic acid biosynthesis glycosyltransferase
MSMVGPQISLPGDYEDADEVARQKYNVKPGLTGLWQMAPNDEFSIFKDKDLNIYYIHNQSVLLDAFILLRVLLQVKSRLSGRWGTRVQTRTDFNQH